MQNKLAEELIKEVNLATNLIIYFANGNFRFDQMEHRAANVLVFVVTKLLP